jgi:Vanillate O-demethylase oxygenase C-terminal domain
MILRHRFHVDPNSVWVNDRHLIQANYQLITDNPLDLTHVSYVHGTTISATPRDQSEADAKTLHTAHMVKVERWRINSMPPPSCTVACEFKTEGADRWTVTELFPSCAVRIHTGAVDTNTGTKKGRRDECFVFRRLNIRTPDWSGTENNDAGRIEERKQMLASLPITFSGNKVLVESVPSSLFRKSKPLIVIAPDAGMVRARQLVKAMIDAEDHQALGEPTASVSTDRDGSPPFSRT